MIYIDDILEQEYLNMLGNKYSKTEKEDILFIFFMRMFIVKCYPNYNNIEKIHTDIIADFLHEELKLDDVFLYKDTVVKKHGFENGNCTINIIDNWRFEYLNQFVFIKGIICEDKINNTIHIMKLLLKKYYEESERALHKYPKKTDFRRENAIYLVLKIFEKDFNFTIKETSQNQYISYKMFSCKTDVEAKYSKYNYYFMEKHPIDLEVNVETYIENHHQEIFPFIKKINRQYIIGENIIDILGYSDNKIYIIEIKNVRKPKDLLFQLKNYKYQIEKRFPDKEICLISVTPALNEDYQRELKEINTDMYFFAKKQDKYTFYKKI